MKCYVIRDMKEMRERAMGLYKGRGFPEIEGGSTKLWGKSMFDIFQK